MKPTLLLSSKAESRPAWKPAGSNNRWAHPKQKTQRNAIRLLDPTLIRARSSFYAPSVPENTRAGSDWDADSQSHMAVGEASEALREVAPVMNNRDFNDPKNLGRQKESIHLEFSHVNQAMDVVDHDSHYTGSKHSVESDSSLPSTMPDHHHELRRGLVMAAENDDQHVALCKVNYCHYQDLSKIVITLEKSFEGLSTLIDELERKRSRKLLKKAMKTGLPTLPIKLVEADLETVREENQIL